jgi:flagellar motility protein MotE (MotC chaperone)
MIALCLVGAACNRGEESAADPVADGEAASTGEAEDDLEFDDEPEVDPELEAATPEGEARAKVEQAVAASRLALDGERLAIDTRKAEVDAAAAELETRLSKIAELEQRLDERIGVGETARLRKAQRIGVLAKLILSMPPQSAAAMVEKMSDEDAQLLLLQMTQENERKASKLLAAMPGERAAQLGQLYLDRDPKTLDVEPKPEAAKAVEAAAPELVKAPAKVEDAEEAEPFEDAEGEAP